jgi:hypothetical protein
MPRFSREWTEDVIVIPENALLLFSKRDAQIARNWSKAKPGRDIFDDKRPAVV